jgi:hypothetical protein
MPIIRLSDSTYRMVAEISSADFISTGARQADGTWLVPIEDHVIANLGKLRLHGETDEDLVARLIRGHLQQKPN